MDLRELLKDFCVDAYQELRSMREIPRAPYNSPMVASNEMLAYPLSQLKSYTNLVKHMVSSGLLGQLQDMGHMRAWDSSLGVFEWLFLERVMACSTGTFLDMKAFNKVFNRASAELSRSSFCIRRITILSGVPRLSSSTRLGKGLLLSPLDFSTSHSELAHLLGWRFQDRNRAPSFWVNPGTCILIQDCTVPKKSKDIALVESLKRLRSEAEIVATSLKLCLDTPICSNAVYGAHLSAFPLLPLNRSESKEYGEVWFDIKRPITRAELLDIHRTFGFIQGEQHPSFFETALNRFADSYRFSQVGQNIVDLVVALEAMLGAGQEELRRRLATNASFVLGRSDSERWRIYRQVSAGYKLRSVMVHGYTRSPQGTMSNALQAFSPKLKAKTPKDFDEDVRIAVVAKLQVIVRLVLRAYIYMKRNSTRSRWLNANDFEDLQFDSKKRSVVQKQLGIK